MAGGAVLLTGSPAYLFQRDLTPTNVDAAPDSVIGAVVDARGRVMPVRTPLPGRQLLRARGVAARVGGWHVVFAEQLVATLPASGPPDSTALWYGRYHHGRWSSVERIGVFRHTSFARFSSSPLVANGDELLLVYSDERAVHPGAVVAVRRSGRGWRRDTLHTRYDTDSPRIIPGRTPGEWTVIFRSLLWEHGRGFPGSLFAATLTGSWSTPTVIRRSGRSSLNAAATAVEGGRGLIAWSRLVDGEGRRPSIVEAMRWPDETARTATSRPPAILIDSGASSFAFAALTRGRALWLLPTTVPDSFSVRHWDRRTIQEVGRVHVGRGAPPLLVRMDARRALLITSRIALGDPSVPPINLLSTLTLVCGVRGSPTSPE